MPAENVARSFLVFDAFGVWDTLDAPTHWDALLAVKERTGGKIVNLSGTFVVAVKDITFTVVLG